MSGVTDKTSDTPAIRGHALQPMERNRREAAARIDRFGVVLALIAATIFVAFAAVGGTLGEAVGMVLSAVTLWFVLAASDVRPGLTFAVRLMVVGGGVGAFVRPL